MLKTLPDASVDSICTDPPYALTSGKNGQRGFMNQAWDVGTVAHDPAFWAEVLRVAKPGAYLVAFGGTRTVHRMATAIEDAGWEIRGSLYWAYGSGFPKSLSVSKAIDKAAGARREVVGRKIGRGATPVDDIRGGQFAAGTPSRIDCSAITAPATPEAQQWNGWGTALKPAVEPLVLARKPLSEGTVAANVLEHGTGALNIDACRVGTTRDVPASLSHNKTPNGIYGTYGGGAAKELDPTQGRWPPNLLLSHHPDCQPAGVRRVKAAGWSVRGDEPSAWTSGVYGTPTPRRPFRAHGDADGYEQVQTWDCHPDCAVASLDRQAGPRTSGKMKAGTPRSNRNSYSGSMPEHTGAETYGDAGSVSRFFPVFYAPKASRRERSAGLDAPNSHNTVKPLTLCRWLTKLITPPNGKILDPFSGSASIGCAALQEGFSYVGIELSEEYAQIGRARLAYAQEQAAQMVQLPLPEEVS